MESKPEQPNSGGLLPPPPPPPDMLLVGSGPTWPPGLGGPPIMATGPPPSLMGPPPVSLMGPPPSNHGSVPPGSEDANKNPPPLMSLNVGNPAESEAVIKKPSELVLPKALEDVLALKTLRAKELGAEEALATTGAVVPTVPLSGIRTSAQEARSPQFGRIVPSPSLAFLIIYLTEKEVKRGKEEEVKLERRMEPFIGKPIMLTYTHSARD
ncbi:cleavage and polyadenylation specificity factor subunit 6-like isoform X2 [Armigeres subalbatus]|uniref:cleavage and polyadenylation specificity factor subunit 6-like isoform X2 n=1 Tax=Armigeres subalbatus TaxID=124917 RepID=UPI002ED444B5